MLCLSRKNGETISIGDSIVVTVKRIRGKVVSIGITAPKSLVIRRGELADERVVTRKGGEAA